MKSALRCASLSLLIVSSCGDANVTHDSSPSPILFVDGTEEAGIRFLHDNGRSEDLFFAEQMGVGAIFFDADGDGDPDLLLLNGNQIAGDVSERTSFNAFYLNDGAGHFSDASESSGLADVRYGMGVCGADYDNDGDIDLFVSNFDAPNALYRNEGDGSFVDLAAQAGVEGSGGLLSSCAFADVDGDGLVDLYVGYCHDHGPDNNVKCEGVKRDGTGTARKYCSPADFTPLNDTLFRNLGDGTFEDISESSGISSGVGRTLGVAFADYDNDGDQDLFVACDRTRNLYYQNDGSGKFTETGLATGASLSESGRKQAGMGIAAGDFDGDQNLDVVITYFKHERNAFYSNMGDHVFRDNSLHNGTGKSSRPLLAWGVVIFDADLDSDSDVFIVNGRILPNLHLFKVPTVGYEQPNLMYENQGQGQFRSLGVKAGAGLEIEKVSRGLAMADVDGDGDLDLLVANIHERPDLLINESPREGRHWLMLKLIGTASNRDGIGARALAYLPGKTIVRELFTGQSYLSQSDLRIHFGLGLIDVLPKLEIRWPSGRVSILEDVAVDQVLEITEPE